MLENENVTDATSKPNWDDWKWHVRNELRTSEELERFLGVRFDKATREKFKNTVAKFPMAISPYYASLIDTDDIENCPIFRQAFPSPNELRVESWEMADPLAEDTDSPAPGITHRYPDRVLFVVSTMCAMYCRHCTRKRKVGDRDMIPSKATLQKGIDWIRKTPEIRDVLVSGGDPFMLSDRKLDWLLGELRSIDHVEVIRIGTRTPVVLPQRITPELVAILKKHHPLWLNTHFNHPREITPAARKALAMLADAGIPLGNQSVLLAGVNDCPQIMKSLVHKLVLNRVRPYYIYQCDLSEGLSHFRTPIGKGIEIMESLNGHTSGFAIPRYVVDAPGGGGKIPLNPNYIVSWSSNKVVLRNYEGVFSTYKEPEAYREPACEGEYASCKRDLELEDEAKSASIGIEKLLSDTDTTISLTPRSNERHIRRKNLPAE